MGINGLSAFNGVCVLKVRIFRTTLFFFLELLTLLLNLCTASFLYSNGYGNGEVFRLIVDGKVIEKSRNVPVAFTDYSYTFTAGTAPLR